MGFVQETITTPDGIKLVADVAGPVNAPAVVLMHGGGQTRHSWHGAMEHLARDGYHVVSYDARGHGESSWSPKGDYAVPALASDLRAVLARIPGPVALVGASMGGMTAFYTAGTSGDASPIKALVMVDIVLHPARVGTDKIVKFMNSHPNGFASIDEVVDAVAAYNPDRPRPKDTSGLYKNLRKREDGRLYWHWDPRLLKANAEPPIFTDYLVSVAHNVKVPTLLVRGGHSDVVDDKGVEEMKRLVPQTEVYDVAGAGHMVAGDRNDAFNAGVTSFLHRHLPAPRR